MNGRTEQELLSEVAIAINNSFHPSRWLIDQFDDIEPISLGLDLLRMSVATVAGTVTAEYYL